MNELSPLYNERVEQDLVILPGGVHVWDPVSPELGTVPDDVIDRRSQGYTLHLLETPGWQKLETEKLEVFGDLPDQAMKLVAATGDEFVEMLTREIGGSKQLYNYKVRIFGKREDFCRYANVCGASNALSLYDPKTMEIGLHFGDQTDREDFESTYAHEFVHAFIDRIYDVTEPLWFSEGMAEYYSRLNWTKQGYRPTGKTGKR